MPEPKGLALLIAKEPPGADPGVSPASNSPVETPRDEDGAIKADLFSEFDNANAAPEARFAALQALIDMAMAEE